jgi:hypothetical protein
VSLPEEAQSFCYDLPRDNSFLWHDWEFSMGCDIHCWAEAKKPDGTWDVVPGIVTRDTEPGNPGEAVEGRNYALFALLAGVRNYDDVVPLAEPRGIPHDGSDYYLKMVENWGGDGHSHSWLTLAELLAHDWAKGVKETGLVSAFHYAEWKSRGFKGNPKTWNLGMSGKRLPSTEAMDEWIAKHGTPLDDISCRVHVYMEWQRTDTYHDFPSAVLHRLHRFGKPEDVRLCFFFDN